ncbi:hypothetical protein, conserved [Angomonas deanei]|uniref:NTF2-like domain-containing protein n=1 Tax=Angomonas deanei TaxID=59799 RepID=A0A7G2CR30_9TRYP|nr:hypothetical protein, conserved [Angomonas deanei]
MSYNLRKLKFFVDNSDGDLEKNHQAVEQFCLAEDDGEVKEMGTLMHPFAHFSGLWGVTRGFHAAQAVLAEERAKLRLTWEEAPRPVTSRTFIRHGHVHFLAGTYLSNMPIVGPALSAFFQKKVKESIVVRDGKVVFRDLGLVWSPAKF